MTVDWRTVSSLLRDDAQRSDFGWQFGQDDGLVWLATALETGPGALIADEVGLGKTRIAMAAIHAVASEGGRVAVIVPPTLLHQWEKEHVLLSSLRDPSKAKGDAEARERRQFRTFLDVFSDGSGKPYPQSAYPLSKRQPFVLISHGFGLGQRIGQHVGEFAWALPYIVRSFARHGEDNWRAARGLRSASTDDPRIELQLPAARWLSKHLTKDIVKYLDDLPPLNEDGGIHFAVQNPAGENGPRAVFQKLIGLLIGPIDLLVIDEAHKSRDEIDADGMPAAQKRLSVLIGDIVRRSTSARRICMTATPIQLSSDDWKGILGRVGLDAEVVGGCMQAVKAFEDVRSRLRTGPASDEDVDALCEAADGFRRSLQGVMVRRRWAEQPIMLKAQSEFGRDGCHPHRRWDHPSATVAWTQLSEADRMAFLAAEGRSLASYGSPLAIVERHRAARFSQAIDIGNGTEEGVSSTDSDTPETRRWNYWRTFQSEVQPSVEGIGPHALVNHPRLLAACEWIERVTDTGGKALIFASYNRSIHALSDALNVRRFLRDVAKGAPTKPPNALNGPIEENNPIIRAVLERMHDRDAVLKAGPLSALISRSSREYDRRIRILRDGVNEAIRKTGTDDIHSKVVRSILTERLLGGEPISDLVEEAVRLTRLLQVAEKNIGKHGSLSASVSAGSTLLETMKGEINRFGRGDFARILTGETTNLSTRHVLQALFNERGARRFVLVAQSKIASEGLNLHEACRHVLFVHLDWNAAVIEQQIGRVDRINSLWEKEFVSRVQGTEAPRIEIGSVVLEGTSDAEKRDRIVARQQLLGAHLFGELLPPGVFDTLKPEWRDRIRAATPSFSPDRLEFGGPTRLTGEGQAAPSSMPREEPGRSHGDATPHRVQLPRNAPTSSPTPDMIRIKTNPLVL